MNIVDPITGERVDIGPMKSRDGEYMIEDENSYFQNGDYLCVTKSFLSNIKEGLFVSKGMSYIQSNNF